MKFSKWYRDDLAADKRYAARENAKRRQRGGGRADDDAVTYARWLLARDGIDVGALALAGIRAVNASIPVKMRKKNGRTWDENARMRLEESTETTEKVIWEPCAAGYRPRWVEFSAYFGSYPADVIHTVELPHWSYVAPEVVFWVEDERLAA